MPAHRHAESSNECGGGWASDCDSDMAGGGAGDALPILKSSASHSSRSGCVRGRTPSSSLNAFWTLARPAGGAAAAKELRCDFSSLMSDTGSLLVSEIALLRALGAVRRCEPSVHLWRKRTTSTMGSHTWSGLG